MVFKKIEDRLVSITETLLTLAKRRRLNSRAKSARRSAFMELVWTIVFVVTAVIIINMFFFQNYRIPSGSMISTLEIGDLIFVEKTAYGPEILPGQVKLPRVAKVARGDVVSFESPDYAKSGPIVELFDRFVYIVTLSFVNLKKDPVTHSEIVDLLIKRVIALPHERIRYRDDHWEIRREFETGWVSEDMLNMQRKNPYTIHPKMEVDHRSFIEQSPFDRGDFAYNEFYLGYAGFYVPDGMFFPMGDNRLNSHDARDYGPVPEQRIQGKALFRFFPFNRAGVIE